MMKDRLNLIRGELIGLEVEVIDAANPSLIGKKGIVNDETRNLLVIKKDDTTSKLIKDQITIKIKDQTIHGALIKGRPEDRIKITSKKANRITRSVKNHGKNKNKESRTRNQSA